MTLPGWVEEQFGSYNMEIILKRQEREVDSWRERRNQEHGGGLWLEILF